MNADDLDPKSDAPLHHEAQIAAARAAARDALDRLLALSCLEWDRLDRKAAEKLADEMSSDAWRALSLYMWNDQRWVLGTSRQDILDAALERAVRDAYRNTRARLEFERKQVAQQAGLATLDARAGSSARLSRQDLIDALITRGFAPRTLVTMSVEDLRLRYDRMGF
jgi:hypothetical protein